MTSLRGLTVLALLGLVGCGAGEVGDNGTGSGGSGAMVCMTDMQCNAGSACMGGICVAPSQALVGMSVEIVPTPGRSLSAGFSELSIAPPDPLRPAGELPIYRMEAVEAVKLAFTGGTGAPVPVPASVVYTLESSIPRRPPLAFESVLVAVDDRPLLPLPTNLSSKPATIRLIPRAGPDETTPPFVFPAPAGNSKDLAIPVERFAIRGSLRDAIGNVPGAFVARAFQNGMLVSNRAPDENGNFTLIIPAAAAAAEVSVELVPLAAAQPWFKFDPFIPNRLTPTNNLDLGTVYLAAYVMPDPQSEGVQISAVADEPGRLPVARAFVRASAILEPSTKGTKGSTRFQFDSATDDSGSATLRLLTGTAQKYDIGVFPEAGSDYASLCQTRTLVGPGRVADVELRHRPVRTGKLRSASNPATPVAFATVVATRRPPAPTECASPVQLSTTTTTKADGGFELHLDPGTYQIDYIPQSGSAWPRKSELDFVVVEGISTEIDVDLAQGALVQGVVFDSFGDKPENAVANARVSIFDPRCLTAQPCTQPATLLGEALTDANGVFRVVTAVP
jgi:hypothetical protein